MPIDYRFIGEINTRLKLKLLLYGEEIFSILSGKAYNFCVLDLMKNVQMRFSKDLPPIYFPVLSAHICSCFYHLFRMYP